MKKGWKEKYYSFGDSSEQLYGVEVNDKIIRPLVYSKRQAIKKARQLGKYSAVIKYMGAMSVYKPRKKLKKVI